MLYTFVTLVYFTFFGKSPLPMCTKQILMSRRPFPPHLSSKVHGQMCVRSGAVQEWLPATPCQHVTHHMWASMHMLLPT